MKQYTVEQFFKDYPNDDVCLEAIFKARYGNLKFCPHCGAETTFYRLRKKKAYGCKQPHCGFALSPTAGMIFDHSPTPLTKWFYALYLFSVSKNGVSASELQRHLGVTYKTAWRIAKQIRLLMGNDSSYTLTGEVEVDETYIGGKGWNRKAYRNLNRDNKSIVFGMVERDGSAIARHVISSGARALLPEIQARIEPNSQIYSDEWASYKSLPKLGYKHDTVHHRKLQYRKGNAHTQTIESFWSQLKRSIDGTYHVVSPKYLQLYVNEFVYRYNLRNQVICPNLLELAWSQPVQPKRQK